MRTIDALIERNGELVIENARLRAELEAKNDYIAGQAEVIQALKPKPVVRQLHVYVELGGHISARENRMEDDNLKLTFSDGILTGAEVIVPKDAFGSHKANTLTNTPFGESK